MSVRPRSFLTRIPFRLVMMVALGILHGSCQAKQEETPKSPPLAAKPSAEPGMIELPDGSPTLTHLQTERVAIRPIQVSLKAQGGKILPNENRLAHLSPRVSGRIVAVYANLGDRIKAGDRLLLLDSPAFGEAQLEYRKANTSVRVTEKALERAQALVDRGAIGAGEYQRREAESENAKAQLYEAEEKLHLLGMTEQEIARLATKNLPHAEVAQVFLRAPFSGEIIERNATVGEVVDPNKTLFTVADLSTVWVRADFPEQQAGQLQAGLSVEVRVSAYPERVFRGIITYVGAMIDPATRTVMARSDVANPDRHLRPEMFADVTVLTQEQPVLTAPRAAMQQVGNWSMVFVVRNPRRFESREVRTGTSTNDVVEIRAGLQEGEEVVREGSYALKSEMLREQIENHYD